MSSRPPAPREHARPHHGRAPGQGERAPRGRQRSVSQRHRPRDLARRGPRRYDADQARRGHAKDEGITPIDGEPLRVAGRVMAKRGMGKTVFAPIRDSSGDLQLYLNVDHLERGRLREGAAAARRRRHRRRRGPGVLDQARRAVDPRQAGCGSLTKSLRPLPDKWHGLTDVELRYRQRYVDLAVSPEVREVFRKRSQIVRGIRRFLDARELPRGRDADDAPDHRRRRGAPVRHAPQRARHEAVHADRAGAVPQAAGRRRVRSRLRDQPQLPQRGAVAPAQPRVHDARVLPGVRDVHRPDGPDRGRWSSSSRAR